MSNKPLKELAYLVGFDLKPKQRNIRSIKLTNIPAPKERSWAPGCLTLYYGAGQTLKALASQHIEASKNGQDMYQIDVGLHVGKIVLEFLTFEDLKKTKMMNVERVSKQVEEKIQDYWWDYLKQEGRSDDWIKANVEWRRHRYMSDRPDLIAKLSQEPEFKHLTMIVHQMVQNSEIFRVGVITDLTQIKSITCRNNPSVTVTLEPQDEAIAA